MTRLWDTTGAEVVRHLAAARRGGGVASGVALTLIAACDEPPAPAVEEAVSLVAAAHPCRLLMVTRTGVDDGTPDRLDAEISIGGRLGGEAVVLRMQGRLAAHADSVVRPLLVPEVPVVTWWHGPPPRKLGEDPLGVVADRRITDCAQSVEPVMALRQRAADYAPGDTDLAWTRITQWRALLAAALDTYPGPEVVAATVAAPADDVGAALLMGWLRSRLPAEVTRVDVAGDQLEWVRLDLADRQTVTLHRFDGAARLEHSGQEPRVLPLASRSLGELLSEELRRLAPDAAYADALAAATGVTGLQHRPAGHRPVRLDEEVVP